MQSTRSQLTRLFRDLTLDRRARPPLKSLGCEPPLRRDHRSPGFGLATGGPLELQHAFVQLLRSAHLRPRATCKAWHLSVHVLQDMHSVSQALQGTHGQRWALRRGTMRVALMERLWPPNRLRWSRCRGGSDPRGVDGELFGKGQEEIAAMLRNGSQHCRILTRCFFT